jgi:hypothetical protein
MSDVATIADLLTKGGLVTALVLALVGGMRGWYVWKNVHETRVKDLLDQLAEIRKDREYWRETALRTISATSRVATVVEATQKSEQERGITLQ